MKLQVRFLELIDSVFPGEDEDPVLFKGTSTQLQTALCDSSAGMAARQLLSSSVACGQLLTKLCAVMPERFTKTAPKGTSSYRITARRD